jgi:cysteine desulfurase
MGVPERYLRGSLRLTLGADNTPSDIERVLDVVPGIVEKIRGLGATVG